MKKILFAVIAVSMLAFPLSSNSAVATMGDLIDYDTGVRVEGWYVDDARIEWELEACRWIATYYEVTIEYRHTSPPSARPGGFEDYQPPIVGREFVPYPDQEGVPYWDVMGIWYGYAEFTSYIDPDATQGVNHGDIRIHYPDTGYSCGGGTCTPDYGFIVYWSFNIRHRN